MKIQLFEVSIFLSLSLSFGKQKKTKNKYTTLKHTDYILYEIIFSVNYGQFLSKMTIWFLDSCDDFEVWIIDSIKKKSLLFALGIVFPILIPISKNKFFFLKFIIVMRLSNGMAAK